VTVGWAPVVSSHLKRINFSESRSGQYGEKPVPRKTEILNGLTRRNPAVGTKPAVTSREHRQALREKEADSGRSLASIHDRK